MKGVWVKRQPQAKGSPECLGKAQQRHLQIPAMSHLLREEKGWSKATPLEKGERHEALGFGAMKKPAAALGKAKKEDGKPASEKVKKLILKNKKATS